VFCGYAKRVNRWLRFAGLALLASLLALAIRSDFPLCPTASTFGVPCPGCGLTRATLALLHGDVSAALHFHPLVWLLTPLFVVFVGAAALELLGIAVRPHGKPLIAWNGRVASVSALLLFALTLGVWLARFAGYLGGPAPVTSMRDWITRSR